MTLTLRLDALASYISRYQILCRALFIFMFKEKNKINWINRVLFKVENFGWP